MHPLIKQPTESRLYAFDFSANLAATETLSAVSSVVASPAGVTISSISVDSTGKKAQFRISGGTNGVQHKITAIVTTSLGNTLEEEGKLIIEDK